MRSFLTAILALASLCVSSSAVAQGAPDSLSFQGFLTNALGDPIDSTGLNMTFKLYKNNVAIWTETQAVDVVDGVFNVLLGKVTRLDTMAFDAPLELDIIVGDGDSGLISPRTPLAAAAYAKALPGLYTFFHDNGTYKSYNVVGGAANNIVGAGVTGATIGGGGGLFVGTPAPNSVLEDFGTIGGGRSNTASGTQSTVSGGNGNMASDFGATVGGGRLNTAGGIVATVGGGQSNNAGIAATIGGGQANSAGGLSATVGGGTSNAASADFATVGGGQNNNASGQAATVGGGDANEASGLSATIGGGQNNTASGQVSTIPGGVENSARGTVSFAAGHDAKAVHEGTFVWNDRSIVVGNDSLVTTGPNQFLARAGGGFTFWTDSLSVGATLAPATGAWASVSDVNAKTGFNKPQPTDVLERLSTVPIQTWRYKGQDESITHMGPTAQDFYAAFGLGIDDKHIVTVDADGVALAAIQGLYELVQEQQALLSGLQAENEQMRAAMERAGIE